MIGYDRIVASAFGGPEVLGIGHAETLPEPGPGEARVRIEAAGVGYTDTICGADATSPIRAGCR